MLRYDYLLKPLYTEKAVVAGELSKFVFKIHPDATKTAIKNLVAKIFGVNVIKVNVINTPSKKKTFKHVKGVRSGFRKAVVTLRKGESLELTKI